MEKVSRFADLYTDESYTDAVSAQEVQPHRPGSLNFQRNVEVIKELLIDQPMAKNFVATGAEAALQSGQASGSPEPCVRQQSMP
jgi:hypothetical protein